MELKQIKRQIRSVFDPFLIKLGLYKLNESTLSHTQFSIAYYDDRIGIELSVDLSDFFIYALLFKPEENKVPIGYQDKYGDRKKLYFQEALKELSIDYI